jgi:hypothetical protein
LEHDVGRGFGEKKLRRTIQFAEANPDREIVVSLLRRLGRTLYIKQVTAEKSDDPDIRSTVVTHREDQVYLEGAYRGQVNGEIQRAYQERERYEQLADPKYIETGAIFDIMAVTVIQHHLSVGA